MGIVVERNAGAVMPPSTWKRIELEICKLFGGRRSGPVGKGGPDCKGTGHYAIQVKHRTCPKWLIDAMDQCKRDATVAELPTLALHPKGAPIGKTLIIFELDSWKEWHL